MNFPFSSISIPCVLPLITGFVVLTFESLEPLSFVPSVNSPVVVTLIAASLTEDTASASSPFFEFIKLNLPATVIVGFVVSELTLNPAISNIIFLFWYNLFNVSILWYGNSLLSAI